MQKPSKESGELIASRTFSMNDQLRFAAFSADANPIHVDEVLARRSMIGKCIVHGIHGLMYALESLKKHSDIKVKSFEAKFLKPIPLDTLIDLFWNAEKNKLIIANKNIVFTSIAIEINEIIQKDYLFDLETGDPLTSPRNLTLEQCQEFEEQKLVYRGDIISGQNLFPYFFKCYGESIAAEIASTSEIVGMEIPGLHSLFLSIKGMIHKKESNPFYKILNCSRFGVMQLVMKGQYLKCEIDAFYSRNSSQALKIQQVSKSIQSNEFNKVNALIIGGSRGLGELTAKIISCGGGNSTITYNSGRIDAEEVQQEITEWGGFCDIAQLNIADSFSLPYQEYNQIYYFPTPKIIVEDPSNEETDVFQGYKLYYVDGFSNLLKIILEKNSKASIFYPSTTFANNPPKSFLSYVKAKLMGESLCREFEEKEGMRIFYPRLPRLPTDQTLGLVPEKFEDPMSVMYPIISRMQELVNEDLV
jgi:hypothetical protein